MHRARPVGGSSEGVPLSAAAMVNWPNVACESKIQVEGRRLEVRKFCLLGQSEINN